MDISPELKRRIAAISAVLIVFFAALAFILKKPERGTLSETDGKHYGLLKEYMQSQYTEAYADYFEMAYVEGLSDYRESFSPDTGYIEAEFVMNAYYKYPYRDPDTVPNIIRARENGDMQEYKKLYDGYNELHSADYKLKIEARLEGDSLEDAALYGDNGNGDWILLEDGLKEYITED